LGTIEQSESYFTGLSEALTEKQMSVIDFDILKEQLSAVDSRLKQAETCAAELAILRKDIIGRICGMEKAVAVVSRRAGEIEQALDRIGLLEGASAGQLVEQYQRTSAKFRDAFPTTFGMQRLSGGSSVSRREIGQFK
jgi:hypothetical protein